MRRYIDYCTEAEINIDLYDLVEDIAYLYSNDEKFKKELSSSIFIDKDKAVNTDPDETAFYFIFMAREIRKDPLVWERVKHDLQEIIKNDYINIS